uniref:Secreted protein n=1 Tax=Strongyloides papillosus TaxID=174720 RepID=A0A0N5BSU6_STREA
MRLIFIAFCTIVFFSAIYCNEGDQSQPSDFALDMMASLTKTGVTSLIKVALAAQLGPGYFLIKQALKLFKAEPQEVQDKLKEHHDRKAASAPGSVPDEPPKTLSDKAIALLEKVKGIKESDDSEEEQRKKITELVKKPENKDAFTEISNFLKHV